jgi:parallel beta-helix repeat protein
MAARPPLTVPEGFQSVQEAVSACKPGETVKISAGFYEGKIILPEGVSLEAVEPGRVTLQCDGSSGAVLEVDTSRTPIQISGIVFAHEGTGSGSGSSPLVHIISSEVTFQNCVFEKSMGDGLVIVGSGRHQLDTCTARRNGRHGFHIQNAAVEMKGCTAEYNREDGLRFFGAGTVGTLTQSLTQRNGRMGLFIEDGARVECSATDCIENVQNGISVILSETSNTAGALVYQGGSIRDNGVIFEGSVKRATGKDGIGLYAGPLNPTQPIAEPGPVHISLAGVQITANKGHGLYLIDHFSNCTIRDGQISGNGKTGLACEGSAKCALTVERVTISENGADGLLLIGSGFKPKISQNTIQNNATWGIAVLNQAEPELIGNQVSSNIAGEIDRADASPGTKIEGS